MKPNTTKSPQLAGMCSPEIPKLKEDASLENPLEGCASSRNEKVNTDDKDTLGDDANKNALPTGFEPDIEAVDTGCNSLVLRLNETDYKEKLAKDRRDKLFCLVDQTMEKILADLEKENWYHGCLPFEDIVGLLKMDGDFLVRELEPEGERMAMACVTTKWKGQVRDHPVHHLQIGNERLFTLDGINKGAQIMPLIKHHYQNAIPIDGDVLLKNPIPKQKWELSSEKITMDTKIGSGQFGEVWKGTMKEDAKKPPVVVAIKVKKVTDQNKTEINEMYKEARIMRQYKHKNVVKFYGIVNKSADKVMIVMELVIGGALDDHLRKSKDVITSKDKIGYAIDAAIGMAYLHSKGCIHRDIACRNCLIDVKKSIVKISDFGLSKQVEVYKIQAHERLPIRWQAPEVISTRIYTAKCDVYSYGILLWEIFNNGEQPFRGMSNKIIKSKICDPKFRPPVDPTLPIVIQRVMRTCWRADPKKRPMMAQVARFLIHAPAEMLQPNNRPPSAKRRSKRMEINRSFAQKSAVSRRGSRGRVSNKT